MHKHNVNMIKKFMQDELTQETVKAVILESFMKKREGDVHTMAAQMLAIDMLHDSWKELEKHHRSSETSQKTGQVGM